MQIQRFVVRILVSKVGIEGSAKLGIYAFSAEENSALVFSGTMDPYNRLKHMALIKHDDAQVLFQSVLNNGDKRALDFYPGHVKGRLLMAMVERLKEINPALAWSGKFDELDETLLTMSGAPLTWKPLDDPTSNWKHGDW